MTEPEKIEPVKVEPTKTPRKRKAKSTEKVNISTPSVIIATDKIELSEEIKSVTGPAKDEPALNDTNYILENQEEIIFKLDKLLKLYDKILINLEHKSPLDSHLADIDLGIVGKANPLPNDQKAKRNKREVYTLIVIFLLTLAAAGLIFAKYVNLI